MTGPLAGRTLLVTGAGSGIGRACARRLHQLGADLILAGRRAQPLRETLPGARTAVLDHRDDAAVAAFAAGCPDLDGMFLGSNLGLRAIADSAAYSVAKAGVHMLARVLALEWAGRGVRCNAIAPGPVRTAMVDQRLDQAPDPQAALAALAKVNPLGRLGREEEIAALAAYLLGDESRWTTGTVIPIDGGASAVF